MDWPTVLRIVLTWPPRKMSATIATMAINARISAYSAETLAPVVATEPPNDCEKCHVS